MDIQTHCSLLERNTFGIEAQAAQLVDYDTIEELQTFLAQRNTQNNQLPLLHIGGGSNLVLLGNLDATVLHSRIRSIDVTADNSDNIYVRVGAGIIWDEWVQYTVDNQWYGLENLSLIPGEVGASAVQNIGAYGVEACDNIVLVDTIDLQTGQICQFTTDELAYGYRTSRFKTDLHGRYAVTHVHFRLSHHFNPRLDYGGIRDELTRRNIADNELTANDLRQIIIDIRRSKLPDPKVLGNAGSFFKNPVVERSVYDGIASTYNHVPHYDVDDKHVKIPAGWMIEQCGWKGRRLGNAGVYEHQALILVNHGGATGQDIARLCKSIQHDVHQRFGIEIEPEANFISTSYINP